MNKNFVAIDYTNPATWPIEARPCIVAWDDAAVARIGWTPGAMTSDTLQTLAYIGDNRDWLWAECESGEYVEYDEETRPSHWCYAPQFEGAASECKTQTAPETEKLHSLLDLFYALEAELVTEPQITRAGLLESALLELIPDYQPLKETA